MCASPLRLLRSGPPPPRAALLPDAQFFTRRVAVAPGATPAEAASQIELALEALSPFPLTQLYYGWFWQPGQGHALVFAAYRRRFTTEQTNAWAEAEIVLPAFAALLGAALPPAATVLLPGTDSLTAVQWGEGGEPTRVETLALAPEAGEEERARRREEFVRGLGGDQTVIELADTPAADASFTDHELTFRSGDVVSRFPASVAAAMDVRDKAELALRRGARRRDILLWRIALGAVAALLLLGIGEVALIGARAWQNVRLRQVAAQKPVVDRIAGIHTLTNRIEDFATKRLLPLEMLTQLVGFSQDLERKPAEILFTRVAADQAAGLNTLTIEARTTNPAQVNAYEATLRALPTVLSADAKFGQVGGDRATFTLTVVFKPDALKPNAAAPVAKAP